MGSILKPYGVQTTVRFALRDYFTGELFSLAVAAGDSYVAKDGGGLVQTTNAVTHPSGARSAVVLTAAEMTAAQIVLFVVDQSTPKLYADFERTIETYNNVDAEHPNLGADRIVTALMADTGITAGGVWTFEKAIKVLTAWAAGNWRDKSGSPGTYEILDPDDGSTVILEVTPAAVTPYKQVTDI